MSLRWLLSPGGPADAGTRSFPEYALAQARLFDGLVLWDSWPLLHRDGSLFLGERAQQHWFALAAPRNQDPDLRHAEARIHHLVRTASGFEMVGALFPDHFTPGSREWSGSAVIDGATVTMNFTAAGRRGDAEPSAEQRLFAASATMRDGRLGPWERCRELLSADGERYRVAGPGPAIPGRVKGFRDPELFRDEGARDWMLFTGSSAAIDADHDGVIGLAWFEDGRFLQCVPLVDGSGITREMERPHIRLFDERLYLFWSVQSGMFGPACSGWPTGLYGATATGMQGPWSLLNGDGLVAANPSAQPHQAYSWLVLPDGEITSFADRFVVGGREVFVGGFAPFTRLTVNGDMAWVSSAS